MKKIRIAAFVFTIIALLSFSAQAALQNLGTDSQGNRLIYDTDFDITWYDFTNSFNTWNSQMSWAGGLSVTFGSNIYTNWRLPTALNQDGSGPCSDYNCTGSEMGHLYYIELGNTGFPTPGYGLSNTGDFQNLLAYSYWSGTEYAPNTIAAWRFSTSNGIQEGTHKGTYYSAMAVMDGLAVAPEPISSTLFIIGGATLGFRRFRKKFKK